MNSNTEDLRHASEPGASADTDADSDSDSTTTKHRPPLRRPVKGRMVAGVSVALGRHFNIDVTIVRIVFVVLTIVGFTGLAYLGSLPLYLGGIPLYLACWLLIPEEGSDRSIISNMVRSRQDKTS